MPWIGLRNCFYLWNGAAFGYKAVFSEKELNFIH